MSSRRDASRAAIAAVARALGDERNGVVFVGGTVAALYPLALGVDVRPTVDVDAVIDVVTTADYYAFVDGLRARGFEVCTDEGAPLCRRVCGDVRVDIMATADTGIGPTNRWSREAVAAAASYRFAADLDVRAITPLYFVATKLEAFAGRGRGDYQASRDVEDVLSVLAGLDLLRSEVEADTSAGQRSGCRPRKSGNERPEGRAAGRRTPGGMIRRPRWHGGTGRRVGTGSRRRVP